MVNHYNARFFNDLNSSNYGTAGAVSDLQTAMQSAQNSITALGTDKADVADTYSKAQVDSAIGVVSASVPDVSGLAVASNVYSKTASDAKYALASGLSSLSTTVSGKASASDMQTVQTYIQLLRDLFDVMSVSLDLRDGSNNPISWTGLTN